MRKSPFTKMSINMLLALLAAVLLVAVNEVAFMSSHAAIERLDKAQTTRRTLDRLVRGMLSIESGLRGYLLTGDVQYIEPYAASAKSIDTNIHKLHDLLQGMPEDRSDFIELSSEIARRISELDLSLQLRRNGNEDAWKFVLSTDVGLRHMQAIRMTSERMIQRAIDRAEISSTEIVHALRLSRIGIAAVAAIGLLAFYMYLRKADALQAANEREKEVQAHERNQLEQQVRDRTASLGKLATHLQQVREEERGHLARELHDELGALLTAAKLDVARLRSRVNLDVPEISVRLNHLVETLNSVISLKRRIIEDLRPSSLSNLGLTATLEILTREFSDRSKIDVEISLEAVQLSDSTQLTVYRLIQESLTNISKYANASKVLITVHDYPTHVTVQVRDDGTGFDTHLVSPAAHGLAGMHHRVEAAGGRLTVTSTPGEGTLVSATLPHSS
ncbi:sensor histidine kinase [Diaphorobacter aerolatus]|uniref:histidine kinase n=1 Tax=Diaphorobacter aerolatus TaxID=1288495 RepID=A0A7H0GHT3_9BURK|nr:CHASE3 domain-containing protein [Diaphorobacter aerolatus]QNP47849.1 CHASE3 domain-containing protein [Diaphorobacter aerolatus]